MVRFTDCKINIGLDVLRRRTDGYHDIVTAMVPVPWHDVVEIVPSAKGVNLLTVYGRKVDCSPEDNLVMKAARLMQERYDVPALDIGLQKIVPDGAGLGGGSGDATACIMLINDMYSLGLDIPEIASLSARLGADCPFFAYNRPMLATGTGTTLEPIDIDLSGLTLLIAKPQGASVSTRQAYASLKPSVPERQLDQLLRLPVEQWQGLIKNDFETTIFAAAPQVRAVKETMLASGAIYASMSGSGAAVYGLFRDASAASEVQALLTACDTFTTTFP